MAIGSAFRAVDVVVLSADPVRQPAVVAGDPQVIVVSHPDPAGWDGWALGEFRGRCPHAWIVAVGVAGLHGDTLRLVTAADVMWDPDANRCRSPGRSTCRR